MGEGIFAQIMKSKAIKYSPMPSEEMEKLLDGIFKSPEAPKNKKIYEKIARRKAPWECNKK